MDERWSLAGRGQLGVIAGVTLQTRRRPWRMTGRILRWSSLSDHVTDRAALAGYDFVRARVRVGARGEQVTAHVGGTPREPPPHVVDATPPESIDLYALLMRERSEASDLACPALELVLPLPCDRAWRELADLIVSAGVPAHQPEGHAVMIVERDPRFPLAPIPTPSGVMLALRPKLPPADARALVPALQAIGRRAIELGARIYLMSIELDDPDSIDRQLGAAAPRWRALKTLHDPRALLNPGLLTNR